MLFVSVCAIICQPLSFAFGFSEMPGLFVLVHLLVLAYLSLDVFLRFFVPYATAEKKVEDFKSIAINYLRSSLLIDLATSIPFEIIFEESQSGGTSSGRGSSR